MMGQQAGPLVVDIVVERDALARGVGQLDR